jgi:hypothetical protein
MLAIVFGEEVFDHDPRSAPVLTRLILNVTPSLHCPTFSLEYPSQSARPTHSTMIHTPRRRHRMIM